MEDHLQLTTPEHFNMAHDDSEDSEYHLVVHVDGDDNEETREPENKNCKAVFCGHLEIQVLIVGVFLHAYIVPRCCRWT